jgi:multiple sugar transport system permease protein
MNTGGFFVDNTYSDVKDTEKKKKAVTNVFIYMGLTLWALLVIFPFYWMILTSFKSYASYNAEYIPRFLAIPPTLANFSNVFTAISLGRYLLNTLVYTLATTFLMLVIAVLSAFAFARLRFKGRDLLFTLFLSLMMIPNELVIITNFVTITDLNMRNTFWGLILPSAASVFYIYLLKENFAAIPDELYWAAKVDGTKDMRYLLKVMVPMCRPTIITIIILKVIECWNSYVWPRLITDDPDYFLVSNGIQELRENGMGRENIPAMMAAVVVISLPLIVLFLIFRKKIMAGVARGGTKG